LADPLYNFLLLGPGRFKSVPITLIRSSPHNQPLRLLTPNMPAALMISASGRSLVNVCKNGFWLYGLIHGLAHNFLQVFTVTAQESNLS
jgi:hypothetical protein